MSLPRQGPTEPIQASKPPPCTARRRKRVFCRRRWGKSSPAASALPSATMATTPLSPGCCAAPRLGSLGTVSRGHDWVPSYESGEFSWKKKDSHHSPLQRDPLNKSGAYLIIQASTCFFVFFLMKQGHSVAAAAPRRHSSCVRRSLEVHTWMLAFEGLT